MPTSSRLLSAYAADCPESARRLRSDPDRFVNTMRAAGLDPAHTPGSEDKHGNADHPAVGRALLLAARLTRVVLTPEVLRGPLLGGVVRSPV
ncbi:DUF6461 domain-containing protein [Streptosporangium longisporum]|uniref:DUF6461 domain-containing protein n=1 Tax=Streptosporangium longisporum TaxID=46187 RepID=UPI0039A60514